MLRRFTIGLLVVSFAGAVVIAGRGDSTSAQPSVAKANAINAQPGLEVPYGPDPTRQIVKPANPLPIRQVVLFNSGVGYFHRTGMVEGDARVDLQFQSGDINDLIKSLVIEDTKGKVLPLRYDSQEPIEKTLRSFAINLSSNPSFGQILNQTRGEKVEPTLVANNAGLPGTLTGTIIGMESANRLPTPTSAAAVDMELVNLMCSEGLRTVPINQIQRLRYLNPIIESELRRALEVVAGGHDSQKKSVRLGFAGEGKREVKVGYVTENPIWKTSYRVVIDKDGKTKLLGWANIENTSDEDWQDIKLTLVSGRPISFQMDLYPPLFIPRPTVEPELFASLRPPTYLRPLASGFNFQPNQFGGGGFQGGFGGGQFQGGVGGNTGGGNLGQAPMQQMAQQQALNPMFNGNNLNMNRYSADNTVNIGNVGNQLTQQKLTFKDLQDRRNDNNKNKNPQDQEAAKHIGGILTGIDPELIEAALTAEDLGNPARFLIEEKVSLPRQQSAMLPILEQPIDATRVSIYNQRVQAKHPLFGLKLKNNSKQSLMQGPIAVYEDQQYAGDARILDLQPGEERFISYAIDTGTEVLPFDKVVPAPEMTVRMENGRLNVQYKLRTTRTYLIKNRSPETRKVVIEQPARDGWKFTEARKVTQTAPGKKDEEGIEKEATWKAGDIEKPSERTRELYRFTVDVKAGETVKYEVSEELPRIDPFENTKQADWTGFATTLGLDVWSDSNRTPENNFGLEVVDNALKVVHKDRRTTTYHLKNRADVERSIWLEHFVPKGRLLIGDVKPAGGDSHRYRHKLILAPGKTLSQTVVEEFEEAKPEMFAMKTGSYGRSAQSPVGVGVGVGVEINDLPADRYITELGFDVWTTRKTHPEELTSARFIKGELHTTAKNQETVTYHIRNYANDERSFTLDHHVRPLWSFVGTDKPVEGLRTCFRATVKSAKDQTVKHDVSEEKTMAHKESLDSMTDSRVFVIKKSARVNDTVKEQIRTAIEMLKAKALTTIALMDLRAQLKEITEEQNRIKGNLERLPETSDVYKRLIDKFDKQESALEKVQTQMAEKTVLEKSQKKEYDAFLEKLN